MENRSIFPKLFGNDHLKKIMGTDICRGTFGHAYILEGPAGSGKHTAAASIAAALACQSAKDPTAPLPCGSCLACRKIAEGFSPDVFYIHREPDKATLGVDIIREMREDLCIAPNENEKKVYIIEEADRMTSAAQNALLLSLESPPPYVVFLLLTENASALLETVQSRAPVLRMQSFGTDILADYLKKDHKIATLAERDPDFFAQAVTAAGGAIGRARQLLDRSREECSDYHALRETALRFVHLMFFPEYAETAEVMKSLPKSREDTLSLLEMILLALRDLAAIKKGAAVPLMFYLSKDECKSISDRVSITRICAAQADTFLAHSDLQSNASVYSSCTALLLNKH